MSIHSIVIQAESWTKPQVGHHSGQKVPTIDSVFRLRWILWGAGAVIAVFALSVRYGAREKLPGYRLLRKLSLVADRHFGAGVALLCTLFLVAGFAAKYTQLAALKLSAQDFWLFEDMLRQMLHGAPFLTRFAPQAPGFVQHGAVHAFFIWYLTVPLSWILGTTGAALAYNPLLLAGAGAMLAVITRPRWGAASAWALALAFLLSSYTGKLLMYETHPETAYPLLVFAWAWAAGWGDGKIRPIPMLLALLIGTQIKVDGFLVFLPLIAVHAWKSSGRTRRAAALSFAVACLGCTFQVFAIHRFANGSWGPSSWQGLPVTIPASSSRFPGVRWDSLPHLLQFGSGLLAEHGGFFGMLLSWIHFIFSRPFASLVALAPWVLISGGFWIAILPLSLAYSLLGGLAASLMLYYAAPFLGTFWLFATRSTERARIGWVFPLAFLIGSGGLEYFRPAPSVATLHNEFQAELACLDQVPGRGVVTSPFLGWMPRERIYSDRMPAGDSATVQFAIFSTEVASFELPASSAAALSERLSKRPDWVRLGPDCHATSPQAPGKIFLFAKRSQTP
jgi:hypothetical protein